MAATVIKSSDLDFNNIKESLKNFFKQQDEFSDYDFDAVRAVFFNGFLECPSSDVFSGWNLIMLSFNVII